MSHVPCCPNSDSSPPAHRAFLLLSPHTSCLYSSSVLLGWGWGQLELSQQSSSVFSRGGQGEDRVLRNLVSCTSRVPRSVSPKHSFQSLGVGFEVAHEHITTKMRYAFPKFCSASPVWGYPPLHQQQQTLLPSGCCCLPRFYSVEIALFSLSVSSVLPES